MSEAQHSRHESTKRIFLDAVESGLTGDQLAAWLNGQCGSDAALRSGVETLLRASKSEHQLCDLVDQPRPGESDRVNLAAGQWLGSYQIETLLGEGGMGVVYRARQRDPIERTVAIKMVKPGMDSREMLRRFQWEQAVLARLEHPNIARLLDAGQADDGRPYFVMEFVKGEPLIEYCNRNRSTIQERFLLFGTVCSAIRFAHQQGVLHRDLKPGNLLVTDDGKQIAAKVIDFGIARLMDDGGERLTRVLRVLGTRPYVSPEQVSGDQSRIDTRSDVFSLGVVLHELIVGAAPDLDHVYCSAGSAESHSDLITRPSKFFCSLDAPARSRIANDRQTTVPVLQQFVTGDLDWILMKAIGKTPTERYGSVEALANDLSNLTAGLPVQARRQTPMYLVTKFLLRHKVTSLLILATISSILLGFGISLYQVGITREAHRRSERLRLGMVAAQKQTQQIVEAADLRLAAKAISDGDFLEAAEMLDRQNEVNLAGLMNRSTKNSLAHKYLQKKLEESGRSRYQTPLSLHAMAYDPKRRTIMFGGEQGVVRVLDLAGDGIRELPSSGQPSIDSLTFSTVTEDLFAGGSDGSIKAMSLVERESWREICKYQSVPLDFCVSQNGDHLFVCDGSADVSVVEIESGEVVRRLRQHKEGIDGITISDDGSRIATASKDQTSVVWQWPAGEILTHTSRSDYRLVDIALDSAGKTLVDGSVDGEVRLVDVETGKSAMTIRVPSAVSSVAISDDGNTVVAGCQTGIVYRLTRDDFERSVNDKEYASQVFRKSRHQAHDSRVQDCLCLGPESVFSVGSDGRLAESNFRSELIQTTERTSKYDRVAVSPDGRWIAAHDYYQLELIETDTGRIFRLDATLPDYDYAGLNFSPRGDLFLATQDGRMAQITISFPDGQDRVDSPDRSISASVRSFDTPGKADYAEIRFSQDGGRMMLFSRRESQVVVVAVSQWKVLFQKKANDSYTADLSASGRFLASSYRGDLWVHEVDSGQQLASSTDHHSETINDVRFSADERRVYTASNDRRIKRWDYRGDAVPELIGVQPGDVPKFLSLSRDGETLLSSGRGQQVWLWHTGAMQKLFPVMPSPDGYYRTYLSADDSTLIGLDRQFQVKWTRLQNR